MIVPVLVPIVEYGLQKDSQLTEAFVRTVDENVIDHYRVAKDEIHLDILRRMIADLRQKVDAAPRLIEKYPQGASDDVKGAIDLWNNSIGDIGEYEERLADLERLLEKVLTWSQ